MNKIDYFCCDYIKIYLQDRRYPIYINHAFREYYLKLPKENNIVLLIFCPWCSCKLPSSLRDEFFSILKKEYKIIISLNDLAKKIYIPKEFETDEWWIKRGYQEDFDCKNIINHKRLIFL